MSDSEEDDQASRYPRRREAKSYAGQDEEDDDILMKDDEDVQAEQLVQDSNEDDDDDDEADEEEEIDFAPRSRRAKKKQVVKKKKEVGVRRTSSRANKFQESMAEPQGISDLLAPVVEESKKKKTKSNNNNNKRSKRSGSSSSTTSEESEEGEGESTQPSSGRRKPRRDSLMDLDDHDNVEEEEDDEEEDSEQEKKESKPRKKAAPKKGGRQRSTRSSDDDDASMDEESGDDEEEESEEEEDDDPMKIQRIIGSKSEPRRVWKDICSKMDTVEVSSGSVWHQEDETEDPDMFEERFLVKWADKSYLHCSWETASDLEEQIENAKTYMSTFFRKSKDGCLFSPEERNDGEFFDPAFLQIDRVLGVVDDNDNEWEGTAEQEDELTEQDLDIVTDKSSPEFGDEKLGRTIFVKWCNQPYSSYTFEMERDLIINGVEYKPHVKAFFARKHKPSSTLVKKQQKEGEKFKRKLYMTFGENSKMDQEARNAEVAQYQSQLQQHVYKNGGQLRDYQAEGVSWMISNYMNQRSCILADEMGLGKTLQTAATLNIIASQIQHRACFLIIAPLSTIPHWRREFEAWTDMNVVIYHGSAEDRRLIRENEIVYSEDRASSGASNFLRRCKKNKNVKQNSPWMIQVVIATPEILVCEDAFELSSIDWEVMVVDEAHRLKNFNSKLAVNLRDSRFKFKHIMLCTGTPIQNDMKELWTLLHFIDREAFEDMDEFLEKYGNMKSKEIVDDLHEMIRPYILRRLKEDVEKSMPPKEETIIEVELTVSQKQYYRALYEKNVRFLHKGKSKALDGPSINNLAMQLRKCCNHVCLLNGIEEELRKQHSDLSDADFLTKGSGKLILLDKLLPRLKEEGHRVLIFSQFKIMLDILEDYLVGRKMTFSRIDGSITGLQRQTAIDRFQSKEDSAPFIMMLSTRAGGVGINLTAADTVIVFDSDWNPQNDLQAQARCHRIGQDKAVKVYRLLSARTYEMQMFDLSSRKMGLDQAVLRGFEGGSGEGALSKEEVETLLKHGAYSMITEDKEGKAESASNEFVNQDIDSILERRSRLVVHDGSGTGGSNAGGTFSKASFKVSKSPSKAGGPVAEDVDVDDPKFWQKMLGEALNEEESTDLDRKQRRLGQNKNYSEDGQLLDKILADKDDGADSESSFSSDDESVVDGVVFKKSERAHWGGSSKPTHWKKEDAEKIEQFLYSHGYGKRDLVKDLGFADRPQEAKRMACSIAISILLEASENDAATLERKYQKNAEKQKENMDQAKAQEGGLLVSSVGTEALPAKKDLVESAFQKLWKQHHSWASIALHDAQNYVKSAVPRDPNEVEKAISPDSFVPATEEAIHEEFARNVWGSLKSRGWKARLEEEGPRIGQTTYIYEKQAFLTIQETVQFASSVHPELSSALNTISLLIEREAVQQQRASVLTKEKILMLNNGTVTYNSLRMFLQCYAPLPLLVDRSKTRRLPFGKRLLVSAPLMENLHKFMKDVSQGTGNAAEAAMLDRISWLCNSSDSFQKASPHPLWTGKQDAVLVLAMSRHGYLEANFARIMEDKTLRWGAPFVSTAWTETQKKIAAFAFEGLVRVANRALRRLQIETNNDSEIGKALQKEGLPEHFGLKLVASPEESSLVVEQKKETWKFVKSALLEKHEHLYSNAALALPPRKEMARRAKCLLMCLPTLESDKKKQASVESKQVYPFAVLDQNIPANKFLAAILRALIKGGSKEYVKRILKIAEEEATTRASEVKELCITSHLGATETQLKVKTFEKIVEHIKLVEKSLSQAPRLWKNVFRVILADPPQTHQTASALFPTAPKPVPTKLKNVTETLSYARQAIEQARERAEKQSQSDLLHLRLTSAENLILETAVAHGIPVYEPKDKEADRKKMWVSFGQRVKKVAEFNLNKERQAKKKAPKSQEKQYEKRNNLAERTNAQVEDYSTDPETLAKKTIMLLGKITKKAGLLSLGEQNDRQLGSNVLQFFENQCDTWARQMSLVDQGDDVLTLSAVDFLDALPPAEQRDLHLDLVAAYSKPNLRDAVFQVAAITMVAFLCMRPSAALVYNNLNEALKRIGKSQTKWEKAKPAEWSEGRCDAILLKRAMFSGMENYLEDTATYGEAPVKTFRQMGLNARVLQERLNVLCTQMYTCAEEKSKTENVVIELSDDSDVELSDGKRKSAGSSNSGSAEKKLRRVDC